jgi:hypothetical protein
VYPTEYEIDIISAAMIDVIKACHLLLPVNIKW